MNARGERIILFGDSLTYHSSASEIWDVNQGSNRQSSQPGDLLASMLLEQGAAAVRTNARVSRSAWNFWGREPHAQLLARDREFRPTKVVIILGTNDIGLSMAKDEEAMRAIRDTYAKMGAEVWAIGPFRYTHAATEVGSGPVVAMMARVFGKRFIDGRSLSVQVGRAADGVHFRPTSARQTATNMAAALLSTASPRSPWLGIGLGAAGVIGALVLVSILHKRRMALLQGPPSEFVKLSKRELLALEADADEADEALEKLSKKAKKAAAKLRKAHAEVEEDGDNDPYRFDDGPEREQAEEIMAQVSNFSAPDADDVDNVREAFRDDVRGSIKNRKDEIEDIEAAMADGNPLGAQRTPHERDPRAMKQQIFELLKSGDEDDRAVARDLALEVGMLRVGTLEKVESIPHYSASRVTIDGHDYFWEGWDPRAARKVVGKPIEFAVKAKSSLHNLQEINPSAIEPREGFIFSRKLGSASVLKRVINAYWPDDGTKPLEGPRGSEPPVGTRVRAAGKLGRVMVRAKKSIKVMFDDGKTKWIPRTNVETVPEGTLKGGHEKYVGDKDSPAARWRRLVRSSDAEAMAVAEDLMLENDLKLSEMISADRAGMYTMHLTEILAANSCTYIAWAIHRRVSDGRERRHGDQWYEIDYSILVDDKRAQTKRTGDVVIVEAPEAYDFDAVKRIAAANAWEMARVIKQYQSGKIKHLRTTLRERTPLTTMAEVEQATSKGGLFGLEIVDGKRHDGSINELIRSGHREIPCKSGIKSARCWTRKR